MMTLLLSFVAAVVHLRRATATTIKPKKDLPSDEHVSGGGDGGGDSVDGGRMLTEVKE